MSPCETCVSSCCRKAWPIAVTAEEAPTFGDAVILTGKHGWSFVGELRKREDGACVYLGPDGCGVYDKRPQVCRDFLANDSCGYAPDPRKQLGLISLRVR